MSGSTKPPTGPVCYDCSSAFNLFVERNCFEYAFVGQEDDDMLEWFENACAEFQAQCDGGRGRGKPLPRGLKPEGLKEEGLKTDTPP